MPTLPTSPRTNLTDAQLLQHLANAAKTGAMCGGHGKAEANRRGEAMWRKELETRGVAIPSRDKLFAVGIFNGDGAF